MKNCFLNINLLSVDISLTIQDLIFKLYIYIKNVIVEGTVSQTVDVGPGSLSIKFMTK